MGKEIHFQVPSSMSALHVLSHNALRNGDRVEGTWIHHKDGTKSPFWTVSRSGSRVKASTIFSLSKLEARVYPLVEQLVKKVEALWPLIRDFSDRKMRGRYKLNWYEYTPGEGVRQILWTKKQLRAYNSKKIPELIHLYRRWENLWGRIKKLRDLLFGEILHEAYRVWPGVPRTPAFLTINGRDYLLVQAGGKVGGWAMAGLVEYLPKHEVEP